MAHLVGGVVVEEGVLTRPPGMAPHGKRTKHFVGSFSAGLSCLSAFAAADSRIVEREFAVPAAGGTIEYITQKSFSNSNGTFTLVAGQRCYQQKRIHAERCASVGGKDVFDESVITVSGDVADVTVCQAEDGFDKGAQMIEKNPTQVIKLWCSSLEVDQKASQSRHSASTIIDETAS